MFVRPAVIGGRLVRLLAVAGLVAGATTAAVAGMPASAHAAERLAAGSGAPIHPGVPVTSSVGQCTANFVFRGGGKTYLGQAAHCTGTGSADETDGCKSKSLPLGAPIKIEGASRKGRLAYNSWLTMRSLGERDKDTCAYNDFALVEVDPADVDRVSPTVPRFGGPTGVRQTGLEGGASVYSYQNSSLRQGVGQFSPKSGVNLGDSAHGYNHEVATASPGVPGDSGSGFMDSEGRAFGVLSTLNLQPSPGTNGVGDLGKELAYASAHGNLGDLELVRGTEPFHTGGMLTSLLSGGGDSADRGAPRGSRSSGGGLLGG